MDPKEPEQHSLVKSCTGIRIVLGGPKENEARKSFEKVMKAFGRVEFALTHQKSFQAVISTRTNARGTDQKVKDKEGAYPQSGF